jgi:hypothetical protein
MSPSGGRSAPGLDDVKALLRDQKRDIQDLSAELQRKEITPVRILRLMKIVARNADMMDRLVGYLESRA